MHHRNGHGSGGRTRPGEDQQGSNGRPHDRRHRDKIKIITEGEPSGGSQCAFDMVQINGE